MPSEEALDVSLQGGNTAMGAKGLWALGGSKVAPGFRTGTRRPSKWGRVCAQT